jgi:hypothetical protein
MNDARRRPKQFFIEHRGVAGREEDELIGSCRMPAPRAMDWSVMRTSGLRRA